MTYTIIILVFALPILIGGYIGYRQSKKLVPNLYVTIVEKNSSKACPSCNTDLNFLKTRKIKSYFKADKSIGTRTRCKSCKKYIEFDDAGELIC